MGLSRASVVHEAEAEGLAALPEEFRLRARVMEEKNAHFRAESHARFLAAPPSRQSAGEASGRPARTRGGNNLQRLNLPLPTF